MLFSQNGLAPLHCASISESKNAASIVRFLLDKDAKVDDQSLLERDTALLLVVR